MTRLGRLTHLLVAAGCGLLVFCCLQPMPAAAQSLPPPLPLPDVTVYGTVTRDGEVLAGGAVKALLPNGVAVSAPIGPIDGTAYNYALTIPLFMTATHDAVGHWRGHPDRRRDRFLRGQSAGLLPGSGDATDHERSEDPGARRCQDSGRSHLCHRSHHGRG